MVIYHSIDSGDLVTKMIDILKHVRLTLDRRFLQHSPQWWQLSAQAQATLAQQAFNQSRQPQTLEQDNNKTLKFTGGLPLGIGGLSSGYALYAFHKPLWVVEMYGEDMAYTVRLMNV